MLIDRKTEMLRHTNTQMLMHQKTHKHRDVDAEEDSELRPVLQTKRILGAGSGMLLAILMNV